MLDNKIDTWILVAMKCTKPNFRKKQEMVFCYQNCSDLLWEKNVLVIEAEGREFAKNLRSLEQFVRKVKGQTIFGNRMLF